VRHIAATSSISAAIRLLSPQDGLRRWRRSLAERLARRCRMLIETSGRHDAPTGSITLRNLD
jgi:hypothetical protein